MTTSSTDFLLVGNPENRRVAMFQQALRAQGLPEAEVVSWLEVLDRPERLDEIAGGPRLVRIDSAGENFEVERRLTALGFEGARRLGASCLEPERALALTESRGAIRYPRQVHEGFLVALERLRAAFERRPEWRVLNPIDDIVELFDKRVTSRRYRAMGVPVPEPIDVGNVDELRAVARERGPLFVKLSCGSSASCVVLFEGESLFTSIEVARDGWFNNLKPRRYERPGQVTEILEYLLREGAQVELAVPKATLGGAFFDTRVLCIAGEPAFSVVRQNHHPITNLHLGGWRGDVEALRRAVPEEVMAEAMASCRTVARAYRTLHVGVDLLYRADLSGHAVVEANAFGDLLPNLTRDGLSVYEWEIRAASRTFAQVPEAHRHSS